jgi:protein involved in polysaccharide export with SLBB domain
VESLTLKKAKELILEKVQTSRIKSQCFVNLSRPKIMKVFISGAVEEPGVYHMEGNSRLSDILRNAKGFRYDAQKGELVVTSKDGGKTQVNLARFLVQGDLSANPYLRQGDQVFVPFIDYNKPYVTVIGDSVQLDVQLENGETVSDLLLKFNSFIAEQPPAIVLVTENGGEKKYFRSGEAAKYKPGTGALIEFSSEKGRIYIGGEVSNPGFVTHRADSRIMQYISSAGIKSTSRVPRKVKVLKANGETKTMTAASEKLEPGDVVIIGEDMERKLIIYTPLILSLASLTIAIITMTK